MYLDRFENDVIVREKEIKKLEEEGLLEET